MLCASVTALLTLHSSGEGVAERGLITGMASGKSIWIRKRIRWMAFGRLFSFSDLIPDLGSLLVIFIADGFIEFILEVGQGIFGIG